MCKRAVEVATLRPDRGGIGFWSIAGLALAVRLIIIVLVPPGYPGDMAGWVDTTERITRDGLANAYAVLQPGSLYPPAFMYPLWLAGHVYTWCCSTQFEHGARALDQVMLLGPVLADSLIAGLVYLLALRWMRPSRAAIAGVLYALSPAALTTVAWQGMIGDPYYGVLALGAVLAGLSRRPVLAGACLTLSILIKPQGLAFGPLVALILLRASRPRQIVATFASSAMIVCAALVPFALGGTLSSIWSAVQGMGAIHAYTQNSADNLWMLLQVGNPADKLDYLDGGVPDTGVFVAGLSYQTVGLVLFCALYLATLVGLMRAERFDRAVAVSGAVIGFGFFFLNTRMHVNYSFMGFPFLCILAGAALRPWIALASSSVACLVDWDAFGHFAWPGGLPVHQASAALYGLALLLVCSLALNTRGVAPLLGVLRLRRTKGSHTSAQELVPINS